MNPALLLFSSSTLVHLSPVDLVIIVFYFAIAGGERCGDLCQGDSRVGVSAGASGCAVQLACQHLVGWTVAGSWRVFQSALFARAGARANGGYFLIWKGRNSATAKPSS
jgi:hypothetical protein